MATSVSSNTYTYTFAQNVVFLSDNLRNSLQEVIRENGLSPNKLMQDWIVIETGIQTWLRSRHLYRIVIEFFRPSASISSARWDIPIGYDGLGVANDMWPDKAYLRQLIAKAARPASDCTYRIVLFARPGAVQMPGFEDCNLLSTGSMIARSAGTIISAGELTACATYWKVA